MTEKLLEMSRSLLRNCVATISPDCCGHERDCYYSNLTFQVVTWPRWDWNHHAKAHRMSIHPEKEENSHKLVYWVLAKINQRPWIFSGKTSFGFSAKNCSKTTKNCLLNRTIWDSCRNKKKKNQEVVITSLCILPAPKLQSWLFSEMIAQVWISCGIWGSWIHTLLSLEQWVRRCLSHRKNRMDEKFFPHNGKPSSQDTKRVVCLLIQETGFKLKAPCGAN